MTTPEAPAASGDERTQFDYLLNAMEHAAREAHPAKAGYAGKRKALFAYVRDLERRVGLSTAVELLEDAREVLEVIVHDAPADEFSLARALIPRIRAALSAPVAAQAADSAMDSERLDWLTRKILGAELRRIGVKWPAWSPELSREAIDRARALTAKRGEA